MQRLTTQRSFLVLLFVFLFPLFLFAAEDGVIDTTYKYAWGEDLGWVNFNTLHGDVLVKDNKLTGYAWSEHTGWIHLSPSSSVYVAHDGQGNLSGYAWGEGIGYINFAGVTIDEDGYFHGNATTDTGRISFNCNNTSSCSNSNFKVKTSWRRTTTSAPVFTGGGGVSAPSTQPSTPAQSQAPTPAPAPIAPTISLPTALASTFPSSAPTLSPNPPSIQKNKYENKFVLPNLRCPYFKKSFVKGMTDPEIKTIQLFLMFYDYLPQGNPTGYYGNRTFEAVKKFQQDNADTVLLPWGMKEPSGRWYITTLKKANEIVECVTTGSLRVSGRPAGLTVNVREQPSVGSKLLTKVNIGDEFKYFAEDGGWYYVTYESGKSGWISGRYVTVTTTSNLAR